MNVVLVGLLLSPIGVSRAGSGSPAVDQLQRIGLNLDLGIGSAYVFRGWNVFQEGSQSDQNALFAPSITYSLPETRLWFSYWSAYQWTGSNISTLVDAGLGNEQNLVAGYDWESPSGTLQIQGALTCYFYPFASPSVTDTEVPFFLEPSVTVTATFWADVGFQLAYFKNLQEQFDDLSYLYVRPTLGKSFEFSKSLGLSVMLGLGYKRFAGEITDNTWDIRFDWEIPVRLSGNFYINPSIHFAWTNLDGLRPGEEYVVWACLNTGVDL